MTTITQVISTAPTAPSWQRPDDFPEEADSFVLHISNMDTELNTWAGQVNAIAGEINTAITTIIPAFIDDAEEQAVIATEQAALAYADRETVLLDKIAVAQDRAYVADSRAYVEALTSIGFGLGIDSNGMLFTTIQETSNISDMTINSNGELIVTLES